MKASTHAAYSQFSSGSVSSSDQFVFLLKSDQWGIRLHYKLEDLLAFAHTNIIIWHLNWAFDSSQISPNVN